MKVECEHLNCDPKWGAWLCRDCGAALTSARVIEIVERHQTSASREPSDG